MVHWRLLLNVGLYVMQTSSMVALQAGACDDDVGECFCPSETVYGLKPEFGEMARLRARPMNGVHPKTVRP